MSRVVGREEKAPTTRDGNRLTLNGVIRRLGDSTDEPDPHTSFARTKDPNKSVTTVVIDPRPLIK